MFAGIHVHLLPSLIQPHDLDGGVAVVIDVLRASTTITQALAAGAEAVVPCLEVEEARSLTARFPAGTTLLGGERKGKLIEGFDLGNSPAHYSPDVVAGKTIIFTTTNGTKALNRAATSDRVLLGSFVNLHAVVQLLAAERRPLHLVCAGTNGHVTLEDCLCAGAIVTAVWQAKGRPDVVDDQTRLAMSLFDSATRNRETYMQTIMCSRGGRNLSRLGMESDVKWAARWDVLDMVPELALQDRHIRSATDVKPVIKRWLVPPQ